MRASITTLCLVVCLFVGRPFGQSSLVPDVRERLTARDFTGAERLINDHRLRSGLTPEALEAHSWLGRGALAAGQLDQAERYAGGTQALILPLLKSRRLDAEPRLPIALGATIEVRGQVLAARNAKTEAVSYLERELRTYRGTSIVARIQKNINLISLAGSRAPRLDTSEFLEGARLTESATAGKVVVMFFWAHWCADCKAQGPILEQLQRRYAGQGLVVVAPTQRFGYAEAGRTVSALEERPYIETVRREFYPWLRNVPMPLAAANFLRYGVSTTPTLVIVDRSGVVRLYHPGRMTEAALDAAVRPLL